MRIRVLALYFAVLMVVGMYACQRAEGQTSNPSTSVQLINANNCAVAASLCTGYTNGATGRIIIPAANMIGSGTNNFLICALGTSSLGVIAEGSFDGVSTDWAPLSNVYGTPSSGVNGNPCAVISFGGFYPYLAFNVLSRTTSIGTLNVWYFGIPGASAFLPAFSNSAGATPGTACDQSYINSSVSASANTLLISGASGKQIRICSFTLSFAGGISSASVEFLYAGTCSVSPTGIWYLNTTSSTPQEFTVQYPNNLPIGQSLCMITGALGTTVAVDVSYAQF